MEIKVIEIDDKIMNILVQELFDMALINKSYSNSFIKRKTYSNIVIFKLSLADFGIYRLECDRYFGTVKNQPYFSLISNNSVNNLKVRVRGCELNDQIIRENKLNRIFHKKIKKLDECMIRLYDLDAISNCVFLDEKYSFK